MYKKILVWGCLLAVTSVALGALGAHALEKLLSERMLKAFETGARYQMYHALAIILTGVLLNQFQEKKIILAFKLFVSGIFLFSGSLYSMSLLSISNGDKFNFLGILTPLGGISFIAGWLVLFFSLSKMKQ